MLEESGVAKLVERSGAGEGVFTGSAALVGSAKESTAVVNRRGRQRG